MTGDIRNYMEVCVADSIDQILKDIDGCKCEKCKMDVTAIALNTLPTKYVVTKKGELYAKLYAFQQQLDVDIVTAITKAAEIVHKNPRHD